MQQNPKYRIISYSEPYFLCRSVKGNKEIYIDRPTLEKFPVKGSAFTISKPGQLNGFTKTTRLAYGIVKYRELKPCTACEATGFKSHITLKNVICPYCYGGGQR